MRSIEVQKHVLRQPFEPFRIHMSDGSRFDVPHRDFILVTRREVIVAIRQDGEDLPHHTVFCDPLHITRIEPLRPRRRRQAKSSG